MRLLVGLGFLFAFSAWLIVRVFPRQRKPKENARVAAAGFLAAYYIALLSTAIIFQV